MHHRHHDAVAALMRTVAAEIVMPRFRNLAADEIGRASCRERVYVLV